MSDAAIPLDPTADLPPLSDVLLDDATVSQLFFDVGAVAELLGVAVKHPGARRAEDAPLTLDEACRALLAGTVAGVQLRYRHEREEWWDTLARTPAGIRLIRISHTRALAATGVR
ncbi:MAG: hypothetical protein HS111_17195 [Kofleriaceae bacterium]|nr:hypothetical protein [Kofleriaceae bacterium]MCL4223094.1 hypothetical protein [Myxococcales bacterium]